MVKDGEHTSHLPAGRRKRFMHRVRTGCVTCRKRKIKCDEQKPVCKRCQVANRPCEPSQTTGVPILTIPSSHFDSSPDVRDLVLLVPLSATGLAADAAVSIGSDMRLAISQRMASYVLELPRRVGYHAALDSAVACVAAALRWRSSSPPRKSIGSAGEDFLLLYGHALQSIQQAIDDPEQRYSAETLAATELLCMFEALVRDTRRPSTQHASGVYQLIQHRGAGRFTTDFEKSLLAAYVSVLIIDAYYSGKRLFLEEPQWHSVLQTCIVADPLVGDRSALRISLLQALTYAPGLLSDCASFIHCPSSPEPSSFSSASLLTRVGKFRMHLSHWFSVWGPHVFHPLDAATGLPIREIPSGDQHRWGRMLEQLCIYEAFLVVFNRLHVALGGARSDEVEAESRGIARSMLAAPVGGGDGRCTAHGVRPNAVQETVIYHCLGAARAILETADEWETAMAARGSRGKGTCIDRDTFLRWYTMQGFRIHPRE